MGKSIFFTRFHNNTTSEHGRDDDILRCNLASKMNCVFFNLIFIYFIFCIELLTGSGRSRMMLITIAAGTSKCKTEREREMLEKHENSSRWWVETRGQVKVSWARILIPMILEKLLIHSLSLLCSLVDDWKTNWVNKYGKKGKQNFHVPTPMHACN